MSDYYRVMPMEEVDASILERITEEDVMRWFVARAHQMRQSLPVHVLRLELHRVGHCPNEYNLAWGGHAVDVCACVADSTRSVEEQLRAALFDDPKKKAAEKKRAARALLEEAAQLEALPV